MSDGAAIIGVDLIKDRKILVTAYDDAEGVIAAFNLNLLRRLNRELGANFKLDLFDHEARWNEAALAVEMHLVSRAAQTVHIAGHTILFEAGESIHTESSRKYDSAGFAALAARAGWNVIRVWTDPAKRFAPFGLRPAKLRL